MLQKIPLTPKTLFISTLAALTIWLFLDRQQSANIRAIFLTQLDNALTEKAESDRLQFDRYLNMHLQTLRIVGMQEQLLDYLAAKAENKSTQGGIPLNWNRTPPWFPPNSVLRSLIVIRHALLFDDTGQLLEEYQSHGAQPLPPQVLHPSDLLFRNSLEQLYMTGIDGSPYVLCSIRVQPKNTADSYTIMLVSPLDDEFLQDSQGGAPQGNLVALIDMDKLRVLASDHPEILPPGLPLATIKQKYKVLGKSFFDRGASTLQIQFSSLLKVDEYEGLSGKFLAMERRYRAVLAALLVFTFVAIIFWVTGQVKALTMAMVRSAKDEGIKINSRGRGDELLILQESFHSFSKEILQSRRQLRQEKDNLEAAQERLAEKNAEIDSNRIKLQEALDNISNLIRQTTLDGSFQVRFENNANLQKCYEVTKCEQKDCPCYGQEAQRCWLESSTFCQEGQERPAMQGKQGDCLQCPVFKEATRDPIVLVGEQFNSMMHILEKKNIELLAAYEDLKKAQVQILQKEKLASVGQLAAGIAHEINNPIAFVSSNITTLGKYLARLSGFVEDLGKELLAFDNQSAATFYAEKRQKLKLDYLMEDGRELIKESQEGILRVRDIVASLKGFSGLDQDERRQVNINDCLALTLDIISKDIKEGIIIQGQYGELPNVYCLPSKLNHVFLNIILNAIKAMNGSGKLNIQTYHENDLVYTVISDTGVGIAAEDLTRIFEPFYTTRDIGEGTGLGLSMSYDIITEHGGKIEVKSEVGTGSTFTVILPVGQEMPAMQGTASG
jgi:signal transduction histidine kinase